MLLSHHQVLSSKTARPRVRCGARCIGHAVRTWSVVCSAVSHLQLGEGARPHLWMNKWNLATPVLKRLSLTQAARHKPIQTGLAPFLTTKTRSLEEFLQYSASTFPLSKTFLCAKYFLTGLILKPAYAKQCFVRTTTTL